MSFVLDGPGHPSTKQGWGIRMYYRRDTKTDGDDDTDDNNEKVKIHLHT